MRWRLSPDYMRFWYGVIAVIAPEICYSVMTDLSGSATPSFGGSLAVFLIVPITALLFVFCVIAGLRDYERGLS